MTGTETHEYKSGTVAVTRIGSIGDDRGESAEIFYMVRFDKDCGEIDLDQANEFVDIFFPGEHCQHEYDCCGRWYARSGDIIRHEDAEVIVSQRAYINI